MEIKKQNSSAKQYCYYTTFEAQETTEPIWYTMRTLPESVSSWSCLPNLIFSAIRCPLVGGQTDGISDSKADCPFELGTVLLVSTGIKREAFTFVPREKPYLNEMSGEFIFDQAQ
uniref:Uncharacterized protein n=1 Tax=Electrophorus electricus TaxID=8005 RepID=A0A4W4ECJ8_ELEEL